jgi:hypothetical protein
MSSPSSIASSSGRQTPKHGPSPKAKKLPAPEPPSPTKAKHLDARASYKFKGKMKQFKAHQELPALESGKNKEEGPTKDNATVASSTTTNLAKGEILAQDSGSGKALGPPRLRARPSLATFQASANSAEPSSPQKPHPSPLKSDTSLTTSTPDPPPDSYPSTPTTIAPPATSGPPPDSTLPADVPLYDPYTNCTKQPPLTKSACLTDLPSCTTAVAFDTYHPSVSVQELDHAKNLVLDLLGWGVEPEFLVDEGISAQLIYRVFTDLNLRLPTNLRAPP